MKHLYVDIPSEFSHWALWRTQMRTEYFSFVHDTTSILAKLSAWCFEHSGDISYSLLVKRSHTDESFEEWNTCLWIYALNLFIEHSGEHWREQNVFCSFVTPQVFWQGSAPGALSSLVTSIFLYALARAILMSPGKEETRVCVYTLSIYSLSTLENTDEKRIFLVRSPHHKHFGSTWCFEHSGDISCCLLVNLSHTDESWEGRNMCLWI